MNDWHLPRNYRFAGIAGGLRSEMGRRDLMVIVSDNPATAAGVFTQNRVCAAPVQLSKSRIGAETIRAIVCNSGNANACTGEQGLADAKRMTQLLADGLDCNAEQVLIASTGIIGKPLPMEIMDVAIPKALGNLAHGAEALNDAAHAILTTDTRIKVATRNVELSSGPVHVTGFAKGAAMIGPNMATMLGFLMTDASVSAPVLQKILSHAVEDTFNCISVEGHTSTNDTVFLLANGEGSHIHDDDEQQLNQAVHSVCQELARAIAADAEGADHLVTIDVEGCRSNSEARTIAKAIAESALVKTAIHGNDPNWGRIVSAAGYAGIPFEEITLSLWLGDMLLYRDGQPIPFDEESASNYMKTNRDVHLRLRLNMGTGRCTFHTCDLTAEYVRLNADYTT